MKCSLFCFVLCAVTVLITADLPAEPALSLLTPKGMKVGTCMNNIHVTSTVSFVNSGSSDLSVSKIRASCACARVRHPDFSAVRPGATGTFTVVFELESELKTGNRTFSVFIECNDPRQPVVSWYTIVDLLPIVSLRPPVLDFRTGSSVTQTVTVVTQPPIRGTSLTTSLMLTMGPDETNFPGFLPINRQFGWNFNPLEAAGTNSLTVWRKTAEPVMRYGRLVISVDADRYFNILELKTGRFSEKR